MGTLNYFKVGKRDIDQDVLHIHSNRKRVTGTIGVLKFIDKDTQQWVYFAPSFDITSYGETEDKAAEMLKSSFNDCIDHMMKLSSKQLEAELTKLGWKHNKLRNKEYSKAYIDVSGELKNFNAVDDKVERLTLEAA